VADWLSDFFEISMKSAQPLAFILILIVVSLVLKILGKIMHNTLKMMSLGIFNAILGGFLGGIKWLLIVSILVNLAGALNEKIAIIDQEVIDKSTFYKPVKNFGPELWKEIKEKK
jgi:membrane protein required for colicin V production